MRRKAQANFYSIILSPSFLLTAKRTFFHAPKLRISDGKVLSAKDFFWDAMDNKLRANAEAFADASCRVEAASEEQVGLPTKYAPFAVCMEYVGASLWLCLRDESSKSVRQFS